MHITTSFLSRIEIQIVDLQFIRGKESIYSVSEHVH